MKCDVLIHSPSGVVLKDRFIGSTTSSAVLKKSLSSESVVVNELAKGSPKVRHMTVRDFLVNVPHSYNTHERVVVRNPEYLPDSSSPTFCVYGSGEVLTSYPERGRG